MMVSTFSFPKMLFRAGCFRRHPDLWKRGISNLPSVLCAEASVHADSKPMVSVVTVVKNGVKTLERTIQSVLRQTYRPLEYLIIDGGSSDETRQVIERYRSRIDFVVSEADAGIGEAFNKGIQKAHGEIIAILNSDDWYEPDAVQEGVQALSGQTQAVAHGPMLFHDVHGNSIETESSPEFLRYFNSLNHPTVFAHRRCYESIGLFRNDMQFSLDYEWFRRFQQHGGTFVRMRKAIVHMASGGIGTRAWEAGAAENFLIRAHHGASPLMNLLLYFLQLLQKGWRNGLEIAGLLPLQGRLRSFFFRLLA